MITLEIKKDEKVIRTINLTPILDIILVALCVIAIILDVRQGTTTVTGYCILAIVLTGITYLPKFRPTFYS